MPESSAIVHVQHGRSGRRPAPWRPVLEGSRAEVVAIAEDVLARLRDPAQVRAAAAAAAEQTAFPRAISWQPFGLAQGYAGLAVMAGYADRCFPDADWDVVGHEYLSLAAGGAEASTYLPADLWAGLSGLAFAVWYLSRDGARYRKLLGSVEDVLLPQVADLAEALQRERNGVRVSQFDLISGLSGVGAYLLCRQEDGRAARLLETVVRALIDLVGEEGPLPRWHTPARWLGDADLVRAYPHGNLNCGLAHGIPGPLAVLALAYRQGVAMDGAAEAIDRLAGWLSENRCDDAWGVNWPAAVALESAAPRDARTLRAADAAAAPFGPSRTAWCYGSPGVARALWLAGEARGSTRYRELAIAAMEAVYRRPLAARQIDSPTLCHGVSGLLQISLRFARDSQLPSFALAAERLTEQLVELFDSSSRLGYYSLEPGARRVDQPGLLDGAPGVPLALLAAATDVEPAWDRLLLLA
jgi:hypothetical protein